jgi:hypothetical protein
VKSKQLRVVDAALLLRVSYRQAKRLWKLYREEGAVGLKHHSAGRPSNRAYEAKFRRNVLRLVREKYSGAVGERFGPTLATEHLESEDDLRWMRRRCGGGCWRKGCGAGICFSRRLSPLKRDFSTRTLIEFGREPLLPFLKFQLNVGHPLFSLKK